MTLRDELKEKHMTVYRLAKESQIPYATVNDICNGRTRLEKCSAETVYKIAHTLNVSMEDLLSPCFIKRANFDNFKSTICHRVKEMGDIDFIVDVLEHDRIRAYYKQKWYPECLYLLAMVDYLCRINNVPIDSEYDDLRHCKLDKPVYPTSVRAIAIATQNESIYSEATKNAIPEFIRFNIVESEVRNVA